MRKLFFALCLLPSPSFAYCPIVLDSNQQIVEDHTCERMEALEKRQTDLENEQKRYELNQELDCISDGRC